MRRSPLLLAVLVALCAGCAGSDALSEEETEIAALRADLDAAQAEIAQLEDANESMDRQLREAMDEVVQSDGRGETVAVMTATELFEAGGSALTAAGQSRLDEVAGQLRVGGFGRSILIEGHSDAQPIRTARYPSNWDLSTARASAVARYLEEEQNVDGSRLRVVGYAHHDPVADNATAEGRRQNRRVRIAVSSN